MVERKLSIPEVQDLLSAHASDWAHLPVRELPSGGTDNLIFLLGTECLLRLPKKDGAANALIKELRWLPKLQGLPLAVPEVLFHGETTEQIGYDFGILTFQPGQIAVADEIADPRRAARILAQFLRALHRKVTVGAPRAGLENSCRGVQLAELSETTIAGIGALADEIDERKARDLWDRGCSASHAEKAVWVHGDLKADNMIARNGALTAVIDWGLAAVGDPAVDYAAAWTWVDVEHREIFRNEFDISQSDWHRAACWALYGAVVALSYYRGRSHEALCEQSRHTLRMLELA